MPMTAADLLNDASFQALLAGVGARLDPQGVGGALGGATTTYIKQRQAAAANAKLLAPKVQETIPSPVPSTPYAPGPDSPEAISELLTPPGQPGLTSLRRTKSGSLISERDPERSSGVGPDILDDLGYGSAHSAPASPSQAVVASLNDSGDLLTDIGYGPAPGAARRSLQRNTSTSTNAPVSQVPTLATAQVAPLHSGSNERDVQRAIVAGALARGLDPLCTLNIIRQESLNQVAPEGGEVPGGLGQFTSGTARTRGLDLERLATDPQYNLDASLDYLLDLKRRNKGDERLGMLAYNGGGDPNYERNVARHTRVSQRALQEQGDDFRGLVADASNRTVPPPMATAATIAPPDISGLLNVQPRPVPQPTQRMSEPLVTSPAVREAIATFTQPLGLTAKDLAGLDPSEINAIVTRAQTQQALGIDIAQLIGTDTSSQRAARTSEAQLLQSQQSAIVTLRSHAAKLIGDSALDADSKARVLAKLNTLSDPGSLSELATMAEALPTAARSDKLSDLAITRAREDAAQVRTLQVRAAKAISESNLSPADQARDIDALGKATTLAEAQRLAVQAEALPRLIASGEDRDALSRSDYGTTYANLPRAQQNLINQKLLEQRQTYQIVANDQGLFRVNAKTGEVAQVGPDGQTRIISPGIQPGSPPAPGSVTGSTAAPVAPTTPVVPATPATPVAPATPIVPPGIRPYESLSPFARGVSEPTPERAFGAKAPTGEQLKAFNYGTRALQAHEIAHELESRGVPSTGWRGRFLETLDRLSRLSVTETAAIGGGLGAGATLVLGIVAGAAMAGPMMGGAILGGGLLTAGSTLAEPFATWIRTPEEKAYVQAKLDFMSSTLRKESGAAISVGEFINEDRRFFAQPGDTSEVLQQKELAREAAIRTFQRESGTKLLSPQMAAPPAPPLSQSLGAALALGNYSLSGIEEGDADALLNPHLHRSRDEVNRVLIDAKVGVRERSAVHGRMQVLRDRANGRRPGEGVMHTR